jgi:hypothetical protein
MRADKDELVFTGIRPSIVLLTLVQAGDLNPGRRGDVTCKTLLLLILSWIE